MKPDFKSDYSFFFHSVLSNHTANNHYGRLELDSPGYQTAASLQPLHENSRQEKIEVQILPQVSSSTTACHIVCSELNFFGGSHSQLIAKQCNEDFWAKIQCNCTNVDRYHAKKQTNEGNNW